jgi:hypothetical protein
MKQRLLNLLFLTCICASFSCTTASKAMNPFYETPSSLALQGDANDHALTGGGNSSNGARQALEEMATYRRTQNPEPINPVLQPAVVRLMWIPDHLNSYGDLIPAHYYYLKVLKDRFAVQDAFELESQLGSKTSGGSIPFVYDSGTKQ